MKTRHSDQGFSLIELMVTLAVLAILVTTAVPAFTGSQLTSQLRSTANSLVASAHLARSEAIKRNRVVRMCVSADGATCATGNWQQGWIVVSAGEVLHREAAISDRFRVSAAASNFDFRPTGVDSTAGSFVVCRTSPAASQERVVRIDAVGRAWVESTTLGICP
jgi:type IV fimbrial biogenesis protein FimT